MRALTFAAVIWGILQAVMTSPANADYTPVPFPEIVGRCVVVVGQVVEVYGKDAYRFHVEEVLRGDLKEEDLQLKQYRDWACCWRWGPYTPGERTMLMLCKDKEGNWSSPGAGIHESPILDGLVYTHIAVERPGQAMLKHGRWSHLTAIPLADVRHAFTEFDKHIRIISGKTADDGTVLVPWRLERRTKPDQFLKYWTRSAYHEAIARWAEPRAINEQYARVSRSNARNTTASSASQATTEAGEIREIRARDRLAWPATRVRRALGQRETDWQHERMLALSSAHRSR